MNETFAKKFFNGQDPIGRRFNWHGPKDPFFEIVGVVPDGKYNSLGEDPKPAVYTPLYRDYSGTVTLVARTRSDPRQVLSALRGEVQKLDPSISVYAAKTLKEHMGTSLFPARMAAIALGSFGVLALILAAVGIYGVMSHVVAGRTREIGLRMALGAQLSDVQKLILETRNVARRDWFVMWITHCLRRRAHDEEPALRREHFRSDHLHLCRLTLVRHCASRLLGSGAQS